MRLSELISKSQALLDKHGDLEVLDSDFYSVDGINMYKFEQDNRDWFVKAGDKVAQINSGR